MDLTEGIHGAVLDIGLLFIYSVETHFLATFTPILGSLACYSRRNLHRPQYVVPLNGVDGLQDGPVKDLQYLMLYIAKIGISLSRRYSRIICSFSFSCPCWT